MSDDKRHDDAMWIRFWGVRGSIPVPGADTAEVGGNTSCVELGLGGHRVIIDAGSGLRQLGADMGPSAGGAARDMKREPSDPLRGWMLIGHLHWDHVQGLPFCAPLYDPRTRLEVLGPPGLEEALRRQMSGPSFPVEHEVLASQLAIGVVEPGQRRRLSPELRLRTARLRHPGGGVAYRLDWRGRSVVYACDTEQPEGGGVDGEIRALAEGADVLIHDAQYLPRELPSKRGWGHSSYAYAAELAHAAGVGALLLTHHDPTRSDAAVATIERRARALFFNSHAAREGAVHPVGLAPTAQRGSATPQPAPPPHAAVGESRGPSH